MSVRIDELQVDVAEPAQAPSSGASTAPAPKPMDLRQALVLLCERELRLKAD